MNKIPKKTQYFFTLIVLLVNNVNVVLTIIKNLL